MEVHLLAIQARVMLIVGLGYLLAGLWLGTDPLTLAWRAALAACIALVASRWLLRQVALVIEERVATDIAERQLVAEQAKPTGPPAAQAAQVRLNQLHQAGAR